MQEAGSSERDSARHSVRFGITVEELKEVIESYRSRKQGEELDRIKQLGGLENFQKLLYVSFDVGLAGNDFRQREERFGHNRKEQAKRMSFFEFCLEAMKDKIMIILFVMGVLSLVIELLTGEHPEYGWIEGFAIILGVTVVILVTGVNDYQKDKKFSELQQLHQDGHLATVFRQGKMIALHPSELEVGDIVEVSDGNVIPGDGILLSADQLEVDESAITGENEKLRKLGFAEASRAKEECLMTSPELAHELPSPVCISGTTVAEGRGKLLLLAIGQHSVEGQIVAMASGNTEITPLEEKLDNIAEFISKIGLAFAVLAVAIMSLRVAIEVAVGTLDWGTDRYKDFLDFLIIGITVLVVAIPEGLPLAVTISLAYSVKKMQKESNLVKRLAACETMGGANMICSDKTGTLTTNKMVVAEFWFDGDKIAPSNFGQFPEYFAKLKEAICITTNARIQGTQEFGSKTEIALLKMLADCGHDDCIEVREKYFKRPHKTFPFSSRRKKSSIVITVNDEHNAHRALVSGASEYVLESCTQYLARTGEVRVLSPEMRAQMAGSIEEMAARGLRTISLGYKDLGPHCNWEETDLNGNPAIESSDFVCLGIVGIHDPVREGVTQAVENCFKAGVRVRMVTGDNKITARAIARECGILTKDSEGVIEGKDFVERVGGIVCSHCRTAVCNCAKDPAKKSEGQRVRTDAVGNISIFEELIQDLDVMARSQPEHKYVLVTGLMQLGHVVAVTGDGTNDAPALKKADVGFAMGLAGTEHAKEAADIILLDDNFASIVNAIKWGRNIYDSIRKFIQFQLTVNVVAVSAAIVGAVTIKQSPLTAVQMLWVNLIMDSFASLALATEPPNDELLKMAPHSRTESIVNSVMWKHILGQAVLHTAVIYSMVFAGEFFLVEDGSGIPNEQKNGDYVISGRLFGFNGEEEYQEYYDDPDIGPSRHFTIVFNTFVLMQLFNEFNARCIREELWVFRRLTQNWMFVYIWVFTLVMQMLMVYFGNYAMSCHFEGLTPLQWLVCVGFALLVFPWRYLLLLIPSKNFNKLETSRVAHNNSARRFSSVIRRNSIQVPSQFN